MGKRCSVAHYTKHRRYEFVAYIDTQIRIYRVTIVAKGVNNQPKVKGHAERERVRVKALKKACG